MYYSETYTCQDLCESMAEEDYLIDEASFCVSEKKYPDGTSATRKSIISKMAEKFKILDGRVK